MSLIDAAADLVGDIAGPYVLITQSGRSIGGIVPNVVIQETISDENVVTQNPTENGTPTADHVFRSPVVVDMIVGFSDSTGQYPGYSTDIYNLFISLRDSRQTFDVYTGKRMLSSMLFTSIISTTDETSENALMLRVRLQEVIISDTSAGSSGGATANNQGNAASTGSEPNVGVQSLQPYSGSLPFFATSSASGLPAPGTT